MPNKSSYTDVPLPGKPVAGSKTGRPIMAALDLLGRRWALRVLWELKMGPAGFRALQKKCEGMSPTVLNKRLKELKAAGVIIQADNKDWALSPLGIDLIKALMPLNDWSETWAQTLDQ